MDRSKITDDMRQLGKQLGESFGESYLGSREERDELTFWVMPKVWVAATTLVREAGFTHLSDLTAVDYLDREPRFDVMTILLQHKTSSYLRLKTVLAEGEDLDSLTPQWKGANWFEREIYDLFGINFVAHPDLRRLLLPADYQGYPLRKDYPVTGPAGSAFR